MRRPSSVGISSRIALRALLRARKSPVFRRVVGVLARTTALGRWHILETVPGEGFAVDASVIEADASRYHGMAPDEIDWSSPERQTRAVAEFLGADDDGDPDTKRKLPKVISPVDPCSAWTAKANKRVQFGYGLNYLIDIKYAVIVADHYVVKPFGIQGVSGRTGSLSRAAKAP
jgi:hypothetical protein